MSLEMGHVLFREDFNTGFDATATLAGKCNFVVASGATCAQLAINGGAARITMAGDDADAVALYATVPLEADESGVMSMHTRIRISDVSVASLFVGWTDVQTDTVVIEDEDGTLNTVATDACGVLFEGEQDLTPQTMGVQGDTDNAQAVIGSAAADATPADFSDTDWVSIDVQLDPANSGTMRVYIDGALSATRTSFFDSSVVLYPVISVDDRGGAYTVDVAEITASGSSGASFD
jgi:hypothetical protein